MSIDPTFRVLDGAIPAAEDSAGVMVNESFVRSFRVHVGSHLTVRTYADRDLADVEASKYESPHGPDFSFRIAAVIRTPNDIVLDHIRAEPGSAYGDNGTMFVSDRFYAAHRDEFLTFPDAFDVQLDRSSSLDGFEAAVKRLVGPDDDAPFFGPPRFAERSASFDTPVGLETTGLLALGIATGLVGAIVVAMLLRVERRVHAHDAELLRTLGVTRNQLAVSAALRRGAVCRFWCRFHRGSRPRPVGPLPDRGRSSPRARSRVRRERRRARRRCRGRLPVPDRDRVRVRASDAHEAIELAGGQRSERVESWRSTVRRSIS